MYVLIFVTMMLMLLSILTYARLDSYRNLSGLQYHFKHYMEVLERGHINQEANKWYETTVVNKRGMGPASGGPVPSAQQPEQAGAPQGESLDKSRPGQPVQQAGAQQKPPNQQSPFPPSSETPLAKGKPSPRLSFYLLIDPKGKETNRAAYNQIARWAKNLMVELYGQEKFFKQMMQERPTFLDDLLNALPVAAENFEKQENPSGAKKLGEASDLANVFVGNDFEDVFYMMLKGCPAVHLPPQNAPLKNPVAEYEGRNEEETAPDNETDDAEEAKEYTSARGYNSLLNYITLKNTTKIRVYLASRELLMAIYGNPGLVDNIIQTRYALYRAYKNGASKSDLSSSFKNEFQGRVPEGDDSLLDFEVTGTNPARYNE